MSKPHIFTIENTNRIGKPVEVFLNGKKVDHCIYADTRKGKVVFYPQSLKVHKHKKKVIGKTCYGQVTVGYFKNQDQVG
ncbi:hypothetical protein [Shewanella glacialipiscicola]|uniref:hypothetical protein n=1 Tax=Shewanella glacialipiscicola TaxID=614069 RepID=UPI003D7BFA75